MDKILNDMKKAKIEEPMSTREKLYYIGKYAYYISPLCLMTHPEKFYLAWGLTKMAENDEELMTEVEEEAKRLDIEENVSSE